MRFIYKKPEEDKLNMSSDKKNIPKLIIISSSEEVHKEFEIIDSLFGEGLECLHLRKPDYDLPELEHWLLQINPHNLNKIVIHSHHELTEKFQLKGIHFTNTYLNQISGKELISVIQNARSEKYTISSSIHSMEELNKLKADYDYVFLSPVFNSISKHGYESRFNLAGLSEGLKNKVSKVGVVALGGIDEENTGLALQTGFDGVALLGAIWNNGTESIIEKFRKIKKYNF